MSRPFVQSVDSGVSRPKMANILITGVGQHVPEKQINLNVGRPGLTADDFVCCSVNGDAR